jgi:hypothetical protein
MDVPRPVGKSTRRLEQFILIPLDQDSAGELVIPALTVNDLIQLFCKGEGHSISIL